MNDKIFIEILKEAINGNDKAIETIIEEYGNLINKYACRDNKMYEDCKQYIKCKIVQKIKEFKNIKKF